MDTHHINTQEDNISEMCAYVDDQTRPTSIESLPDDVVFDILVRVPATDIYNAARLVCHKWYQTTRAQDFVRAHLQQSTCSSGLLIQKFGSPRNLQFATQKDQIIEVSQFDYKFTGSVTSSCNGLILDHREVRNPATKKHLVLPTFPPSFTTSPYRSTMACHVASKEYKVVRTFDSNFSEEVECAILTVGVDEDWKRRVDTQHLSPEVKELLELRPKTTRGFVHWAKNGSDRDHSEYVLTLNVETEVITQFPTVPASLLGVCGGKTKLFYSYLPMGRCLSLLVAYGRFAMLDEVWEMEPETGKWTKVVMSIDSESQKRAFEGVSLSLSLRPVGWLKLREVLVFGSRDSSRCIVYNFRTQEIESSFELGFRPYRFIVHENSLAWLD